MRDVLLVKMLLTRVGPVSARPHVPETDPRPRSAVCVCAGSAVSLLKPTTGCYYRRRSQVQLHAYSVVWPQCTSTNPEHYDAGSPYIAFIQLISCPTQVETFQTISSVSRPKHDCPIYPSNQINISPLVVTASPRCRMLCCFTADVDTSPVAPVAAHLGPVED